MSLKVIDFAEEVSIAPLLERSSRPICTVLPSVAESYVQFIDPGVVAITNQELQGGCVGSIGAGIEDLTDDPIIACEPDIAAGIRSRTKDGVIRRCPG